MKASEARDTVGEPVHGADTFCLLCGAHTTRIVQRLSASQVTNAYRQELGIHCDLPVDELMYLSCANCELRFFWPPATGDENFYEHLQEIRWYYSPDKQEFQIAARYIDATDHVLEIGAGRGLFLQHIKSGSYTGLEFSSKAVEAAAASGIALLQESIQQHARDNPQRYDVVCTFQVLEHVAEPRSFIDAAVRVLKPGGHLIVSVPGEDSFERFAYWDVLNMPPHHVTRWTDQCLRSIGPMCGLRLIALIPEPLGRNMRRLFARAMMDHWIAKQIGIEPELLDERVRRPLFKFVATVGATVLRRYLSWSSKPSRRGQAVVAIFEKDRQLGSVQ
jgi:2-polyprenyl-3-methyl-5-hydroxy-6-metoxy-1,4-benzoquinol methylase